MAFVAAIVATVDFQVRPSGFCVRHGAVATRVSAKVDLVLREGHAWATGGFIVDLVIAAVLLVLIENELRHKALGDCVPF